MNFTHVFQQDLDAILQALDAKAVFALSRFADGERAVLEGTPIKGADGWQVPGMTALRPALMDALLYAEPSYYVGISCPCCSVSDREFYRTKVNVPDPHLTYSNVFANANNQRWLEWCHGKECLLVSSSELSEPPFRVPQGTESNGVIDWFATGGIDKLVDDLLRCQGDSPIFVAAGPAASVIVHRYWARGRRDRPIINVGSSLDTLIHGRMTRGYHLPGHPNRSKVCVWNLDRPVEATINPDNYVTAGQASTPQPMPQPTRLTTEDICRIIATKHAPALARVLSEVAMDAIELSGQK